jgi:hypothetical protein
MEFIVYPSPPLQLKDFFHPVPEHDPIRHVLSCFTSFEDAVRYLDENDFDNYGVFVRLRNPVNLVVYNQMNFFFHKPRFPNIMSVAMPPLYIYKRTTQWEMTPFMASHQSWTMETLVHRCFSRKDSTLCFMAHDQLDQFPISSFLKEELRVCTEPVPLLVLDTPDHSLEFAGFVIGLLHQTSVEGAEQFIRNNQYILRRMSIDHRRKMYDIFPEEFIQIPQHVWNTLKRMDDAELLAEDVQELCEKYTKLSLTSSS